MQDIEIESPVLRYVKGNGYPVKFWALYHLIMLALGKLNQFPGYFGKREIINFGKYQYGITGEGFYRSLNDFDLNRTWTMVKSFSPRDRANFKRIIMEISGQDADVIGYLNKIPN